MTSFAAAHAKKDRTLTFTSILSIIVHVAILLLVSLLLLHRPPLLSQPIEVTLFQTAGSLPDRGSPPGGPQKPAGVKEKPAEATKGGLRETPAGGAKESKLSATEQGTEKIGPARTEEERRRSAEEERLARLSSMRKDIGEQREPGKGKEIRAGGRYGTEAGISEGPVGRRLVLSSVLPGYPEWARRKGIESEVVLKFWVSANGKVKNVEVTRFSGVPEFDQLAENALYKWRFESLNPQEPQVDEWGVISMLWRLED
ncbi:MAG: energy transducer TonB [Candidatus Eisenbacteria bacterium]|nr:energy transducer TonB [Candidatus Eisenbacteria bacterium]